MKVHWMALFYMWAALFYGGLAAKSGQPRCPIRAGLPDIKRIRRPTQGRTFVTAFSENAFSTDIPLWDIQVTGISPNTKVTMSINDSDFKKDINVGKGETVTVEIANPKEKKGSGISSCGIIIKANADINVMSRNFKKTSGDVALIHPVDQLGTDYYVITPTNGPSKHPTEFSVLTSKTPTRVDIVLSAPVQMDGKNYTKGDKMTMNLEPFSLMQLQSAGDLSETRVTSRSPVAVMAGHSCVPTNGGCSHVYEQMKSVENWGDSYLVPGLSFQPNSDLVFILASKNTCLEYQSGEQMIKTKLKAGKLMKLKVSVSSPLAIRSTEKIQALFYSTGGQFQGEPVGPFFTKIPDINSFGLTYNLPRQEDFNNLAIIIAKTSNRSEITCNGKALQNTNWKEFPVWEYSWAEYNCGGDFSANTFLHSSTPFGLLTIGYSRNKTYSSVAPAI